MYSIGIDIGGTNIKAGIVDETGKIIVKSSIRTDSAGGYKKIVSDITAQIKDLCANSNIALSEVSGAGIGCPGAIDSKAGVVNYSNNLEWVDVPLCDELKNNLNIPFYVSNDANVAALGEYMFGAGKNYQDVIMITLGTGVGGGIVIGGKLFEGNQSKGAELGHMVIRSGGELCTCGRRGCMESYASATALIRDTKVAMKKDKASSMWTYAQGKLENVSGKTAFECAKTGDYSAKKVVDDYVEALGEGLCNFINIFRPEAIILGGGVCAQGENLLKPLRDFCKNFSYGGDKSPNVELIIASLGNDAGLVGAASLVFNA